MTTKRIAAVILLNWWWLSIGYGYGFYRYGPYIEQATCESQAQQYRAAGYRAVCIEEKL